MGTEKWSGGFGLRAVFAQAASVGHGQAHQVLGFELAQATSEALRFAEFVDPVGPAGRRLKDGWNRMPGVALEFARGAVVTCDQEHIGLEGADFGDGPIKLFDHFDLAGEVAILAGGVGVLEVEEKEVIVVPGLRQCLDLIVERGTGIANFHVHQTGKAPVHRIYGKSQSLEPVDVLEGRNGGVLGETAKGRHVDPLLPGEQLRRLGEEGVGQVGSLLAGGIGTLGNQRLHPNSLGIGIVDGIAQAFGPDYQDKTVFLDRLHEDFSAGNLDGFELGADFDALFGGGAAGATVSDLAGSIHGAEIAADGDIVGTDWEIDPQSFQDAATNAPFEGIVAKKSQVPGAAPGSDSGEHGGGKATYAIPDQIIKIGGVRAFEFGLATRVHRKATQAVRHEENNLRTVVFAQFLNQFVKAHVDETLRNVVWQSATHDVPLSDGLNH